MTRLDEHLLRKRSEHHDGLLFELEEISLHQEEIERIENIGVHCRHLRILLLQNNIISKIENVHKLKELEYLNLALNNINRIENLDRCESLRKLDLTLNFIDFDELSDSVSNLSGLYNLEDLYLVGNPAASNWDSGKYRAYVIARLPQLKQLDGTLISPTERIHAKSAFPDLESELRILSGEISQKKLKSEYESEAGFSRQARLDMYRELGGQKAAKDEEEKRRTGVAESKPAKQVPSVLNATGEVRQCNEGKYEFQLDELSVQNQLTFELFVPKYMDSSLIDIDLNPRYIRCIVRNKLTQIRFDNEISVSKSTIQRSKTSGAIQCTCPFENPTSTTKEAAKVPERVPTVTHPPPLEAISLLNYSFLSI